MAYDPQARRARPRPTADSPVDSRLEASPVVGDGPVPSEASAEVGPEVAAETVRDPPPADSADDGLRPFEAPSVEMTDERADLLHRFGVLGAVALVALILALWRRRRRAG